MIRRFFLSIVVGIVVTLLLALLGLILVGLNLTVVVEIGHFLEVYGSLFGVLAAVWYYFTGII